MTTGFSQWPEPMSANPAPEPQGGHSSHNSVWVGDRIAPHEVESRLRLARYLVKPPVSLERMHYDPDTCLVTYRSDSQGRFRKVTALDFLADLSVHVPDPGEHGVSYLGRCSNRSRGERRKRDTLPSPQEQDESPNAPPSRKHFRTAWAQLLKKVWRVDVTRCSRCGGPTRILSAILSHAAIDKIMDHLGIPRPRAPNLHDCFPPAGAQLRLPDARRSGPGALVSPEDARAPAWRTTGPLMPPSTRISLPDPGLAQPATGLASTRPDSPAPRTERPRPTPYAAPPKPPRSNLLTARCQDVTKFHTLPRPGPAGSPDARVAGNSFTYPSFTYPSFTYPSARRVPDEAQDPGVDRRPHGLTCP